MKAQASYYAATANPAPQDPALAGDVVADVCVVGGGIAGISTALHLAEKGYSVVLLEAERIGWGASGRSGGQAIFGYASGQQALIDQLGRVDARKLWDFSVEALALLKRRVKQHGIDCDLHWGQMHVGIKPRQYAELKDWQQELADVYDYTSTRFLERREVEAMLATTRYNCGLYDAGSGHLHPLNYTLGLAAAARAAGVTLHEQSRATSIVHGETATVRTSTGAVRAKFVALCCNAYVDGLVPALRSRIMPVGTYVIATASLGATRMNALMRENVAVTDINFVLDYFRRSADHRLLFGGRVSYSGRDAFDTAAATRKRMIAVFPQLADVKIDFAWGGYVDITMSRAPDFGRIAPNVYYLQGFSGHGIALTGIAGQFVAEAIAGQAERFDVYTRLKHRNFPGGTLLRTPALVLAMLYYRLRDYL